MLHSFVELACNGELDTRAAEEEGGDEYDPMQEIEVDDDTHSRSRGGGGPLEARQVSKESSKEQVGYHNCSSRLS